MKAKGDAGNMEELPSQAQAPLKGSDFLRRNAEGLPGSLDKPGRV